jgi:hypothetical protein
MGAQAVASARHGEAGPSTAHADLARDPVRSDWVPYALFLSYPLAGILGLTWMVWQAAALCVLPALLTRRRLLAPRGFGIWLLFLGWSLVSATQINAPHRAVAFGYRMSVQIAATILFLWVVNTPPRVMSSRSIVNSMTLLWVIIAVGGFLGIVLPGVSIPALGGSLLPDSLSNIDFIEKISSLNFSQASEFLGYTVPRPATFFKEATQWASSFALLTPVAIAGLQTQKSGHRARLLRVVLIASAIPFVFSLARGAWISLTVALLYGGYVMARRRGAHAMRPLLGAAVVAVLLLLSPLGNIVADRAETGHSNRHRALLARETVGTTLAESPVIGFGSPRPLEGDRSSLGTHGQSYLVLFSHGVPGLAFFLAWLVYTFLMLRRSRSWIVLWTSLMLLVAISMMPFYNFYPTELPLIMVATAVAWREKARLRLQGEPPVEVP